MQQALLGTQNYLSIESQSFHLGPKMQLQPATTRNWRDYFLFILYNVYQKNLRKIFNLHWTIVLLNVFEPDYGFCEAFVYTDLKETTEQAFSVD